MNMLGRILSNDWPRSRLLAVLLLALLAALALAPFLFPGVKALNVAAKILVFIVLAASFDLLLGYTGIVSFAHTMFFGIGAYGVAIASTRMGGGWAALGVGLLLALLLSLVLAHGDLVARARGHRPLLLLDEVAAHLDPDRRALLLARLDEGGGQVWMTGTEMALFDSAPEGAARFAVDGGGVRPL